MDRTTRLTLLGLTLLLVLAPLVAAKPGMPMTLKADEPAYYLMALSLARDGDLQCELRDIRRLFDEFPFAEVRNLILATDDGWRTVFFGKPYIYSLFASPAAALFGANGMFAFNMLLMMAMVWMGASYLSRSNPGGVAALFAGGFFLVSSATAYVFWLQPEIFNMTAVTACLFLGLRQRDPENEWRRPRRAPLWLAPLASGGAIALAAYNKPMLAALGLPALFALWRRRGARGALAFLAGGALTLAAVCGLAVALTGHPSAYLGVARVGFSVEGPDHMPVQPIEPILEGRLDPEKNSWSWLWRVPEVDWGTIVQDAGYFLWGRHTGLFLYMPFALLAVLLFLAHERRSAARWVTLGALVLVAVFFLVWIPFNWHGGGGFVGNRYFVNAYPGFLFLVGAIRPAWATLAGFLAGGAFVGPLLLSPFGAPVPEPTLQAHVRGAPYRFFPVEVTLIRKIPGYRGEVQSGVWFQARKDLFRPRGDELWLHGAARTEVWMHSAEPLGTLVFEVRNQAPDNRIVLAVDGDRQVLDFPGRMEGTGEVRRVELRPAGPVARRRERNTEVLVYELAVRARTGQLPALRRNGAPEGFYLGAALTYLGTREELDNDIYALGWDDCAPPTRVEAGRPFRVRVTLRNRSGGTWRAGGGARVNLSYHWLDEAGDEVVWDGRRTGLPRDVGPGQRVQVEQQVWAPEAPGRYTLVLDPVREGIAWFSRRNDGDTCRAEIEVAAPPAEPGGDSG